MPVFKLRVTEFLSKAPSADFRFEIIIEKEVKDAIGFVGVTTKVVAFSTEDVNGTWFPFP